MSSSIDSIHNKNNSSLPQLQASSPSSTLYQSFPRQPHPHRHSNIPNHHHHQQPSSPSHPPPFLNLRSPHSPSGATEPSSPRQNYPGLLTTTTTTSLTLHHDHPTTFSLDKHPPLAAAALADLISAHPYPSPLEQSPPRTESRKTRASLTSAISAPLRSSTLASTPISPSPHPSTSTTNSNSTSTSSVAPGPRAGPSRSHTLTVPGAPTRGGRVVRTDSQQPSASPSPSREPGPSSAPLPGQTTTGQLEAKVVILGMQGVGKTSIVHRYTTGSFSYSLASTIGASFCTKKLSVDGCKVRLQIWDTAGQERFRSMAPMYYRGANAAILVYDITNQSSFDDIQNWLDELRENMSPELVIQIVGSKADLAPDRRVVDLDLAYQQILDWTEPFPFRVLHDHRSLAGRWPHLAITEVSAKDDFGIEDMFLVVTRRLVMRKAEIEDLRNRRSRESIIIDPPSSTTQANGEDSSATWCCT